MIHGEVVFIQHNFVIGNAVQHIGEKRAIFFFTVRQFLEQKFVRFLEPCFHQSLIDQVKGNELEEVTDDIGKIVDADIKGKSEFREDGEGYDDAEEFRQGMKQEKIIQGAEIEHHQNQEETEDIYG